MVGPAGILDARILVVDDASANVLLLEQLLRSVGYTSVTTTTDPRAVCELYRTNRYDLILLDLVMPGMDGFEVMRGLQEIETEGYLPVLVVTVEPTHMLRALQAGAKDFISKPFDRIEVLTRIHNMLEVRLLLRESRSYSAVLEHYDRLTGLPNRTLYRQLLTRTIERSTERGQLVSVLFVALDRFKNVNDALGRVMGDALLRRVGDQLVGCLGPMDVAARLEGDVFGLIVVTAGNDPHNAGSVATRIRDALRTPLGSEGPDVAVTVSMGIAVSPTDAPDADTLMKYADTALHEAEGEGGDTYRFYSAEMTSRAVETLRQENAPADPVERD